MLNQRRVTRRMDRFPASNAIVAALGTRPMAMCDDGKRTRLYRDYNRN